MKTNKLGFSNHWLAALVMALLLVFTVAANAQSSQSANGLSGTWRVQVQLQVCGGPNIGPAFQSLLSFYEGGTMTGTTLNPSFAAGQRSSDFGVWSYQGSQTYSAASEAYILFSGGPFQRGTQRIAQTITLNGDSFTSVATVHFFDVAHNAYISACAVAVGSRFE